MKNGNSIYWIWLSLKCGIASKEFGRLAAKGLDAEALYQMESQELDRLENVSTTLKSRLADKSLEAAYGIYKFCNRAHVLVLPYTDERYPARLRAIEDPPVVLYALGRVPDWNRALCIGMVGTRKMSEYGKQTAYTISYELAAAGAVVVSGMALGVDGVSACGALASNGTTVAVLGCGIATVYPKEHQSLMAAIVKQGTVLTEYPPSEPPRAENFPKRNRLISGISQGVLVVEGASRSGALITAKKAVEQGRELFALPGKVDESNSDGPNELIQDGANVALCAEDILRYYDFLYHDCISYQNLKKKKRLSVDEAMRKYGVSTVWYRGRYSATETVAASPAPERQKKPAAEPEKPAASAPPVPEKPVTPPKETPENSVLSGLDESCRRVLEAMPEGQGVSADRLAQTGLRIGEIMTCLTMLELNGLISSVPGG
ncbi:MAG: DNA-processing protein DprA, partial [Clostridia bacterium]|nr:DNA-processing protein DprA [Clostridia bacterium]